MKDLTQGNMQKTFFLFAFPLVLAGVLSIAYGLIDTIIAGKYLGEQGLAAIGATSPFISFLSSFFWGYGSGASIYIARLFGAKDYAKIRNAVLTQLLFISACNILISVLSLLFRNQIMDFLQVDPAVRESALQYFCIYISGLCLIIMTNTGLYLLNAFGISSFPLYMSLISTVLNIGGNLLSVAVWDFGIIGIAVSSVLSAAVVAALYLIKIFSCFREMEPGNREKTKLSFSYVKESLSYSLPVAFQQLAMYFATMILSPMVNAIGVEASAAYSVVERVYSFNAMVYQNSAKTVSNFVAQCMGSQKYQSIRKGVGIGLFQSLLFLAPVLLFCSLCPRFLVSLFLDAASAEEAFDLAVRFSRFFLPFIVCNAVNNLFHNLYRGLKQMGFLMTSTFGGVVVRVLSSFILIPLFGMDGFYAGWVISWAAEALFCFILYLSRKWVPSDIRSVIYAKE